MSGIGVADVAEAGGAEQGVGDGVQHHVGVGWPTSPRVCGMRTPPRIERPALDQPVRVVPGPDAEHRELLLGFIQAVRTANVTESCTVDYARIDTIADCRAVTGI